MKASDRGRNVKSKELFGCFLMNFILVYFLLSLSLADFTIGAISMPLYTVYLVLGYWPLGPVFCDIWLSLDYTMSNASVANLLVISFDRYMSVTRPLTYRVRRTRRRATAMIAGAWVVSVPRWSLPVPARFPWRKCSWGLRGL